MPRRSVLTEAQRADLLALPEDEAALVRHQLGRSFRRGSCRPR